MLKRVESILKLVNDANTFPIDDLIDLSSRIENAFLSGNKLFFVGNGGSAAEAMHLAAEFTGKCVNDHLPLPAICLNESQSALTAIGNDYGFDLIFKRQVQAYVSAGDILIALSTSGKSNNIILALEEAVNRGAFAYLWCGNMGPNYPDVISMKVPSSSTPRIQEIHLMWGHILAEIVEMQFT